MGIEDVVWHEDAKVWPWPLTPEQEAYCLTPHPQDEAGKVAVLGVTPAYESTYCIFQIPSGESSVVDLIGYWENGDDIKVRRGQMTADQYASLPEFDGW